MGGCVWHTGFVCSGFVFYNGGFFCLNYCLNQDFQDYRIFRIRNGNIKSTAFTFAISLLSESRICPDYTDDADWKSHLSVVTSTKRRIFCLTAILAGVLALRRCLRVVLRCVAVQSRQCFHSLCETVQ